MSATTSAAPVLVSDVGESGDVRLLLLHRPATRNAIDLPLRVALAEQLELADATASVRVVVIAGADGVFCSGGDISTMQRASRDATVPRAQAAQRVVRAIWSTPKPVLAAVEGPAYGAGTALAAACDRVVAARDARFATTFTSVGLAGDMGIFASLPARVGVARARQMLLLPTPLDGAEAHAAGLVDRVVDPGEAVASAIADADRLAQGPPEALGVIKAMFARPRDPARVLDLEVEHQARLWDTDDFAEGVAAFREKRRPRFGAARR
ncbi:enoyl-CoA hydratase/isomerase family protein [Nocardioides zeae]|uniref:Enoyl-CoA hydratase n=1 Tax=Nocardioides zeae TaxID=1457234 RepID=A0A6P0HG66_9ACTN|nr:enoyl-CoA hydratase-related protein [Nocardioides zeae]NEN77623.1 enoyl-CoA hydratase [Nocardioides zeae]